MSHPLKFRVVERGNGADRAWLYLACDRGTHHGTNELECAFSLWRRPPGQITWQWDGNVEQPTIAPSIDCKGGCGRHFTMVKGLPT